MTDQIAELPAGDIQRDGGVTAGGQQQQGFTAEPTQPTLMSAESQAALTRAGELKQRFLDPSLSSNQRETLMKQISELQGYAFGNREKPAWHEPKPDPRLFDMRPADGIRDAFEEAAKPMSKDQSDLVRRTAISNGLPVGVADHFMTLAKHAELPQGFAKDISGRLAHHYRATDGNVALSPEDHAEFAEEAARSFGGVEKYEEVVGRARALLKSAGMLEFVDSELENTTVLYDPRILLSLANLATARGLK